MATATTTTSYYKLYLRPFPRLMQTLSGLRKSSALLAVIETTGILPLFCLHLHLHHPDYVGELIYLVSEHHRPRPPAGLYCRLGPSKDVKLMALSLHVDGLASSSDESGLKKCLFPSLGSTICSFICNIVVLNLNYHSLVYRVLRQKVLLTPVRRHVIGWH